MHRVLSLHTHSSKAKSHVANLHPDLAARVMHRRLHAGSRRISRLPQLTSDAPDNLERASPQSTPHQLVANAKRLPHKEKRYVESRPGRLIHADMAKCMVSAPLVPWGK